MSGEADLAERFDRDARDDPVVPRAAARSASRGVIARRSPSSVRRTVYRDRFVFSQLPSPAAAPSRRRIRSRGESSLPHEEREILLVAERAEKLERRRSVLGARAVLDRLEEARSRRVLDPLRPRRRGPPGAPWERRRRGGARSKAILPFPADDGEPVQRERSSDNRPSRTRSASSASAPRRSRCGRASRRP